MAAEVSKAPQTPDFPFGSARCSKIMRRAYHVFFASPLPPSGLWSFRKLLDHYSGSNHISFKIKAWSLSCLWRKRKSFRKEKNHCHEVGSHTVKRWCCSSQSEIKSKKLRLFIVVWQQDQTLHCILAAATSLLVNGCLLENALWLPTDVWGEQGGWQDLLRARWSVG